MKNIIYYLTIAVIITVWDSLMRRGQSKYPQHWGYSVVLGGLWPVSLPIVVIGGVIVGVQRVRRQRRELREQREAILARLRGPRV